MTKRKFRIGIDIRILCQEMSGVGRYVLKLLSGLKQHSDFEVVGFTDTPPRKEYAKHLDGFTWKTLEDNSSKKTWRNKILPNWLREHNIDLYHATWDKGIPLKSPCPTIMTIHDLYGLSNMSYWAWYQPKRIKLWLSMLRQAHATSAIITVSEATKSDITQKLFIASQKVNVTYLDCDKIKIQHIKQTFNISNLKKWNIKPSRYFISIAGILDSPRKNVINLIKGYKRFLESQASNKDFKLIIVGRYSQDAECLQIIDEAKLDDYVLLTKNLSDEDLYLLLANAKASITYSLLEGFGIPILEAFYLGVPVITSNTSSMKEIACNKTGLLVDPLNPQELADAFQLCCKNDLQEMTNRAKMRASEFSWDIFANNTIEIYKKHLKA